MTANGFEESLEADGKILKLDGGTGFTTVHAD